MNGRTTSNVMSEWLETEDCHAKIGPTQTWSAWTISGSQKMVHSVHFGFRVSGLGFMT